MKFLVAALTLLFVSHHALGATAETTSDDVDSTTSEARELWRRGGKKNIRRKPQGCTPSSIVVANRASGDISVLNHDTGARLRQNVRLPQPKGANPPEPVSATQFVQSFLHYRAL